MSELIKEFDDYRQRGTIVIPHLRRAVEYWEALD